MPVVRLAGGVVLAAGEEAWLPDGRRLAHPSTSSGREERRPGRGEPIAVGPKDAAPDTARAAIARLEELVASSGAVVAGADVDLGDGFRSARLDGAAEDRRDAVLAALQVLGRDGVSRLGGRDAVAAALLGPGATKPLGAALRAAVKAGRSPVIHLASAASDLLGPERLERLLALEVPPGTNPVPGGQPSNLAGHLTEVFSPWPEPRRLAVLTDLWERVCAHLASDLARIRRVRRLLSQPDGGSLIQLRRDRQALEDDWLFGHLTQRLGHRPSLAEAARWHPDREYYAHVSRRVVLDALAATALARVALAQAEGRLRVRAHAQLLAAGACPSSPTRSALREVVQGRQEPEAGRPGHLAAEAALALLGEWPDGERLRRQVLRSSLGSAVDHGYVALERASDLLEHLRWAYYEVHRGVDSDMSGNYELRSWRRAVGYSPVRPPHRWDGRPLLEAPVSLAVRLAHPTAAEPQDEEDPNDLLWLADLADALAALHGAPCAEITWTPTELPVFDVDPPPAPAPPLRPPIDSVPGAIAGAAQLVRLGATVPPKPRSWSEVVEGLMSSPVVLDALASEPTSELPVPEYLLAVDGTELIGLRVELARGRDQLFHWASHMGNCIATYAARAASGECVLVALCDGEGRPVWNLDVRRASGGGWRLGQLAGRFNDDPPWDLWEAVEQWVSELPERSKPKPPPSTRVPRPPAAKRERRRRPRPTAPVLAARQALSSACRDVLETVPIPVPDEPVASVATRLGWSPGGEPWAPFVAVTRRRPEQVARTLGEVFASGMGAEAFWEATSARPLRDAFGRLGQEHSVRLGVSYDELVREPITATARPVVRLEAVRRARFVDLAMRRCREAFGVLLLQGDEHLDAAMAADPGIPVVGAALLALNAAGELASHRPVEPVPVAVDGSVAATAHRLLDPGWPWEQAWTEAADLIPDAHIDSLRERAQAGRLDALLVPTAWTGPRGWARFWARTTRRRRRE